MKYIILIIPLCFLQKIRAQDDCKLFKSIVDNLIEDKFFRYVVVDESKPGYFPSIPKFHIRDTSLIGNLSRKAKAVENDSLYLISSCLNDLHTIKSSQSGNIAHQNFVRHTDSVVGNVINKKANGLLKIKDKKRRYKLYNEYMKTSFVVDHLKKVRDSTIAIIEISKPIFYENFAVVDMTIMDTGPRNSIGFFALFKWEDDKWKFIARE